MELSPTLKSFLFRAALAAVLGATQLPALAEDGISPNEVVIGATTALTGPIALCGTVPAGAAAYFKVVNSRGGVNGRKIRFEVLDDGYAAPRAIGNVRRLIGQDKAFALVSGCGTATGAAVLSAIESESIPFLFPLVGLEAMISPPKKNVFSLYPLYGQQGTTIVDYVVKTRPELKTAALAMMTLPGYEEWAKHMRAKLASLNIKLVDEQFFEVTASDKAPFVTQMKGKNPDMLVLYDSTPGSARFLIEMQRQNWKPKVIAGLQTVTDESFLKAVGNLADGLIIAPAIVVPASDPRAKECNDALAASDKSVNPSSLTTFGCTGAKVFVEALKRAGPNPTRAGLIAELEKMKSVQTGVSGPVSFGPNRRQGLESVYPMTIENGAFKIIGDLLPLQ